MMLVEQIDRLLEGSCPLRTQNYGGIPTSGGYGSNKEYEVGAARVSEAAHCILGSLGRMVKQDRFAWPGHIRHIKEEIGIIEKSVREYAKPIYTKQIVENTNAPDVHRMVDSIQRMAPKLIQIAKNNRRKISPDTDAAIRSAAEATYDFLVTLSEKLLESVKDLSRFENAFSTREVKKATKQLSDELKKVNL